jgi:hypothetical protein
MAAVLRAQEVVKQQFGLVGVLNGLWRSNRDLKAVSANLKALSELPDGAISDEFLESHIPQVRDLLKAIESLITTAHTKGLMNRTLTAGGFESIRARGQYIADYLDAVEMSVDRDVLNAIEKGRRQIQNGEFEVMGRLF